MEEKKKDNEFKKENVALLDKEVNENISNNLNDYAYNRIKIPLGLIFSEVLFSDSKIGLTIKTKPTQMHASAILKINGKKLKAKKSLTNFKTILSYRFPIAPPIINEKPIE